MKQETRLRKQLYVSAGLSEKEAVLFDVLLQQGEMAATELEKASGLKKNTYALVKSLEAKKLLLPFKRDGRQWYQVAPPDRLHDLIVEQENSVKQTRHMLDQMLPALKSAYRLAVNKPVVRYYEGEAGLREVFRDIYAPKNEPVYGAVDADKIEECLKGFTLRELIPSRIESQLAVKCCFNNTAFGLRNLAHDKQENRESLIMDKDKYPLPAEIETYEDKVAMMSFRQGEFVGLIVENEDFALTLRSVFRYLFDVTRADRTREPAQS
jgi:HTH-type transcriptional regulator, sugar sensing transcriptional regulator